MDKPLGPRCWEVGGYNGSHKDHAVRTSNPWRPAPRALISLGWMEHLRLTSLFTMAASVLPENTGEHARDFYPRKARDFYQRKIDLQKVGEKS